LKQTADKLKIIMITENFILLLIAANMGYCGAGKISNDNSKLL